MPRRRRTANAGDGTSPAAPPAPAPQPSPDPKAAQKAATKERQRKKRAENARVRRQRNRDIRKALEATLGKPNYKTRRTRADGTIRPGPPAFEVTEELADKIRQLYGLGLTDEQVCWVLRIPESTYQDHRVEISGYRGAGLAEASADVRQSLYAQAKAGTVSAMRLYFERVEGWNPVRKVEATGANGGPIKTEDTGPKDRDSRLASVAAKLALFVDRAESVVASPSTAEDSPAPETPG